VGKAGRDKLKSINQSKPPDNYLDMKPRPLYLHSRQKRENFFLKKGAAIKDRQPPLN
jgi:hypothetical protein